MKTKNVLTIICLFSIHFLIAQNPNLEWAKNFGNSFSNSIDVDLSGNIYTTGSFSFTTDFDPDSGITNHTSVGFKDIFVQKMDAAGHFLWAKAFGGPFDDRSTSCASDNLGNVYITGYFVGTIDFDPGIGTMNLTSASANNLDFFVQKLDASGNFQWARSFGANGNDKAASIDVDTFGNVYTTGYFTGTVDFNPGIGTSNLTSNGSSDIFVLKMDNGGNFLWAKSFGGIDADQGYALKVDHSGNVYTTGDFSSIADLDPGIGILNFTSNGNQDIFVQKMDSAGNFLWSKSFGGYYGDFSHSIAADNLGNVYTIGEFRGLVDFDPGTGINNLNAGSRYSFFLQKLDSTGSLIWARTMTGSIAFPSYGSIQADHSGNVYTHTRTNFIRKIDSMGNILWSGNSYGDATSMTVDLGGNIYSTGYFNGIGDFDPGIGTAILNSTSGNTFVQKMNNSTLTNLITRKQLKNAIEIYPNPSTDIFNINLKSFDNPAIRVLDINGKVIFSKDNVAHDMYQLNLDISSGIYILEISSKNNFYFNKILKN
jgi:hypothetical protein